MGEREANMKRSINQNASKNDYLYTLYRSQYVPSLGLAPAWATGGGC